jgi:hypothetical protein
MPNRLTVKMTETAAVKEHLATDEKSFVIKNKNTPLDRTAVIAVCLARET